MTCGNSAVSYDDGERTNRRTSSGLGEWPMSSSICSLTAMTFASRLRSRVARDSAAFLGFQMGDAVMPNTLGRTSDGVWKYSRIIPLYAWFLRVW